MKAKKPKIKPPCSILVPNKEVGDEGLSEVKLTLRKEGKWEVRKESKLAAGAVPGSRGKNGLLVDHTRPPVRKEITCRGQKRKLGQRVFCTCVDQWEQGNLRP